jgi:hypothetical protein
MTAPSPSRARAEQNFSDATKRLLGVIPKETRASLGKISPPDFDHFENVDEKASELEGFVEKLIQARKELSKEPNRKEKIESVALSWFRASYPFASLFLAISKEGANVLPSSLLWLTLQDTHLKSVRFALRWLACLDEGTQLFFVFS